MKIISSEVLQDENCNSILVDEEKKYLEAVLRPFKERIVAVWKCQDKIYYCICFDINPIGRNYLPRFSKTSKMYQGMELGRNYTLKELGLFENN